MTNISRRLRVLHIMPYCGVSGAEQMACHLMVGLSRSHDVGCVVLYPTDGPSIEQRLAENGIPMWNLRKRDGFDPSMFRAMDKAIGRFRPDVVHSHLFILRYALPALLRRRIPLAVHTLHNLAEHEADRLGRAVHRFAFRRAVLPVAISREVAASFERVYGMKSRALIPNCIPVEAYRANPAARARWRREEGFGQDDFIFTSIARLEPQKNPLLAIQAFEALDEPRARLVIMGEGDLREPLENYIRERGLERKIHLRGKRSDVPDTLSASDAFVLSSDWEGSPLAVMEAMAAGLPVIGTTVGGVPELVESARLGILVPPGDCATFTAAMRRLLDCPEERLAMGRAAREHAVETFGQERMVEQYEHLYFAALGRPGAVAARNPSSCVTSAQS